MLIIYGSMMCPDCVKCRKELDSAGIPYDYRDFSADLRNLKEFLKIRDENGIFTPVRAEGKIGIPCIVSDGGKVSLEWDSFMNK